MSSVAFAWRRLVRQPARAVLAVLGVGAVGALLFDMLLLSRGLIVSLEDLFDSTGFDVRVMSTEAIPLASPRISDAVATAATTQLYLVRDDRVVPLQARGGIPSLERAIGDAEIEAVETWTTRRPTPPGRHPSRATSSARWTASIPSPARRPAPGRGPSGCISTASPGGRAST